MVTIRLLADNPEHIATLAAWFKEEWPSSRPLSEYVARFEACAQRDALPLALVAIERDQLLGTVGLRWDSVRLRPRLGPWVAAFYVVPERRSQGIGALLLGEAEMTAARLGFRELYAGTSRAASLLRRAEWSLLETLVYEGEDLGIFHKRL